MSRRSLYALGTVFIAAVVGLFWLFGGASPETEAADTTQNARVAAFAERLAGISEEGAFQRLSGPWQLELPSDHGAHPDARAETWMIAAHLEGADGETIGLNYSLTRFGLRAPTSASAGAFWDLRALYRAHLILVRGGNLGAIGEERVSRGVGTAGSDPDAGEVWIDNWQLSYGQGPGRNDLLLSANVRDVPVRLVLTPMKPALQAPGDGGVPARGFSMTRMRAEGVIGEGGARAEVSGVAWLDRLWGDLPLPGGPVAYDRLLLHLDDGSDMSLLRSRRRDGGGVTTVEGVLVGKTGETQALNDANIEMRQVAQRESPSSGVAFPTEWRITGRGLDIVVEPLMADQTFNFALDGWTGIVRAEGTRDGEPVGGRGTLQLTGYEDDD